MKGKIILGSIGIGLLLVLAGIFSSIKIDQQSNLESNSKLMAEEITTEAEIEVDKQLIAANNRFGFKLFNNIVSQTPEENIFISPASIAIALSMASNGAEGETLAAMTDVLELNEIPSEDIDHAYQKLLQNLQTEDAGVKLAVANSLWADEKVKFNPAFVEDSEIFYQAQVTNLDFADSEAKNIINNWVKEKTNNKITEIIDSISPDNILFLINAIYFKGNWTDKFNKELTTEKPFYFSPDNSQPHPMMSRRGEYSYYENEQFQAIRLPYGEGRVGMYIFLPKEGTEVVEFTESLTAENWQKWTNSLRSQPGKITLPRFKLEYDTELNSALTALGMGIAFNGDRADFSSMISQPVSIDRVKHKTFLEVNEEGTEAAGVTSIGIRVTSAPMEEKPFTMDVNRPFFCAIADKKTGNILFMGNIVKP
ncbi:MAG: serpin family protein [Pleurocapsa sp.]